MLLSMEKPPKGGVFFMSLYAMLQEEEMSVPFFMFIFACYGFHAFYMCSLLLLDIIFLSSRLQNVIRAVTTNAQDIAATFLLMLFMVFIFTSFGIYQFGQQVVFEDDALVLNATTGLIEINSQWGLCPNLGICFLEFVNTGLRSGDIVDGFDDMTYQDGLGPWFDRIVYALAFFLVIGVILFDIVTGIIIDTFSSLREETAARFDQLKNSSFIADIDRATYDELGWSFDELNNLDQDKWGYVYLLCHLKTKDRDELTGAESMIYDKIKSTQSLDISWLPEKISYKMQLANIEADLEDQGDIIADLKSDMFEETRSQTAALEKKVGELEQLIREQFTKAKKERKELMKSSSKDDIARLAGAAAETG